MPRQEVRCLSCIGQSAAPQRLASGQSAAPQRLIITQTQASLVSGDFQIIPNSGGMVKNLKTGSFTHEHHFLAIEQLHFEQARKNALKSADDAKAAELAK